MELIYIYLGKVNGINYDLGINLSQEHKVTYNKETGDIDIEERLPTTPKGFFGDNITNITGILGENGVGKSTILESLGKSFHDRFNDEDNNFMIFFYENRYYSELFDKNLKLKNLNENKYNFHKPDLLSDSILCMALISTKTLDMPNYRLRQYDFMFDRKYGIVPYIYLFTSLCELVLNNIFKINIKPGISLLNIIKDDDPIVMKLKDIDYNKQHLFLNSLFYPKLKKEDDNPKNKFIIIYIVNLLLLFIEKIISPFDKIKSQERIFVFFDFFHELKEYNSIVELINIFYKVFDYTISIVKNNNDMTGAINILKCLISFDDKSFVNRSDSSFLNISIDDDNLSFKSILRSLDNSAELKKLFKVSFGTVSNGEATLLQFFSAINHIVSEGKYNNKIILIDEFDQNLHPEWQRKYLDYLIKYFNSLEGDTKYQIIFTTHSPFVVSDLPRENIIKLSVDKDTGKRTAEFAKKSFASNFYEIMSDGFFLEDSVGEFAKNKINQLIKQIDETSSTSDSQNTKLLQQQIAIIDDDFIREHLTSRLQKKLEPQNEVEQLEKQIAELERRLAEAKKRDSEDKPND